VKVTVNGEPRELPEGTTVAAVVASITKAATGVAVAVNDEVVSRGAWAQTPLQEQDRIEVLTAVQGG
jgi:sulfur carrier protein